MANVGNTNILMENGAMEMRRVTKEEFSRYVWENEILLRENAMLASYIDREKRISAKEGNGDETLPSRRRPGSRGGRKKSGQTLQMDKKIYISEQEIKSRRKQLALLEEEHQRELINYQAMISETDMRITEIKRETFEFKRVVLGKGMDPHTGKIKAGVVTKYYDDKVKAKDVLIGKLKEKNTTLLQQIQRMEKQLKKDHTGETLSEIDFHQLEIENKSFSQKIDAKNKALLRLKVSTAKMGQLLTDKRAILSKLLTDSASLRKRIFAQEAREKTLKEELERANQHVLQLKKQCKKLRLVQTVSDMPKIEDYVKQKEEEYALKKKVKQWKARLSLAQVATRRARAEAKEAAMKSSH